MLTHRLVVEARPVLKHQRASLISCVSYGSSPYREDSCIDGFVLVHCGIGAEPELSDTPHFLHAYTVKVLALRQRSRRSDRPLGLLPLARQRRPYHHPHGVPGASGRLALLPCGMVVAPSALRRLGSGLAAWAIPWVHPVCDHPL